MPEQAQLRLDKTPDAMTVRRRTTVEHVFGAFKHWMGCPRFLARRLANVGTGTSRHVLAYHLKSVLKIPGCSRSMKATRQAGAQAPTRCARQAHRRRWFTRQQSRSGVRHRRIGSRNSKARQDAQVAECASDESAFPHGLDPLVPITKGGYRNKANSRHRHHNVFWK